MHASFAAVIAEAELATAPRPRTARLVLDLGYANPTAAAVTRDLATGVLTQIQALLADPATDLPAHLRAALAALTEALTEQTTGRASVTALNTPLARAWRAHPAGQPRSNPGAADLDAALDRGGDSAQRDGDPAVRSWHRPAQPIGFHCLVCGFTRPAGDSRPGGAPICAGSTARTAQQHAPTPMQPLVLR